jgi:hypothetical protein
MHRALSCPHCRNRGMTLFRKMSIGPKLATACESCGQAIGVPKSILGAYALFWVPIWLSGYIENSVLKVALWLAAVAVLAVSGLYFAPLEPRALDTPLGRWPLWLKVWFFGCTVATIAAFSINFFPSRDYALLAFGVSIAASVPILGVIMSRVSQSERQSLRYLTIFVLAVASNCMAIAVTLPAGLVVLVGEARVSHSKVQHKRKSYKILKCSRYLEVGEDGVFFKKKVCVPNEVWLQVSRGDSIAISERHSWFGDFVEAGAKPHSLSGT